MSDSNLLKSLVEEYYLEVNGVVFWTPYFFNITQAHDDIKRPNLPGPYLGKATPKQLLHTLEARLKHVPKRPQTEEEFRSFMAENLIGVDCSGFAYYVYDRFLRQRYHIKLEDHIFWNQKELLLAYDHGIPWHQPQLKRAVVEKYPQEVALSQIMRDWGWKSARRMVRADRFWHSAIELRSIGDLRPGDMITMRGIETRIGHIIVVVEVGPHQIRYAHASRVTNYSDIGGVHYSHITITKPSAPIEDQNWYEDVILDGHEDFALRRLKVLSGDSQK